MNILIVGVGGQGTLLASRILGNLAPILGLEVKLNEVHGMAQRGGSVVTHVKMADKVYSPVIAEGDADAVLAFEVLEGYRYRHFLKKGGIMVVNTQEILPMPVITGAAEYPKDLAKHLREECGAITVDALAAANEIGNARTVNTVILGCFARIAGIACADLEKALEQSVKPKLLEVNKTALKKGYSL
ncbi:MAG: indolepyruvate oxidoreductase subunit beta [Clostridiales bacterium]|jgi:indolepyruvate ferredoxin oxidoreductase beta subunit|nr:indolepyruvate oxidoreductase subunit beta [Clostridiales bacterium]